MEILNQFGVQPILLAAQVVNFLLLLFILKRFLYKPILKVLDERKQKIADSLKNAQEIEKKLQQTNEQSEKIIADALGEAQKILDQTNQSVAQILVDANKKAEQILKQAADDGQKIMERQRQALLEEIRQNAAHLVTVVFEKIANKKLTLQDHQKFIEDEVRNLS